MSKKKKKKNNNRKPVDAREKVLNDMLACNPACGDLGTFEEKEFFNAFDKSDYYATALPGFQFAEQQFVNYMFSDGMGAGGVTQDGILDNFRFKLNLQNMTNDSVFRNAIRMAHCRHGECGVRWKDGDVYLYKAGTYAPLTITDDGIEEIVGYIATTDGNYISDREYDLDELSFVGKTLAEIEEYFAKQNLILLDKSEFVNLRNDTSKLHGEPPLEKDKLRVELVVSVYERLNYDVNYDGPGRILFPVKGGYADAEENEISTTRIAKAIGDKAKNKTTALDEIRRITEDIRDSSSDAAIAVSDGFGAPIHLPRVTKATEFLEWIAQKEGEILADLTGLPSSLLEEGQLSGNVSMTRIIDNAVLTAIISFREHYMSQLSPMIARNLGLEKVFFKDYVLQSEESDTDKYSKMSQAIQSLAIAKKNAENVGEIDDVIRTFCEMIMYNTHDSIGDVVELSATEIEKTNEKEKKPWIRNRLWKR